MSSLASTSSSSNTISNLPNPDDYRTEKLVNWREALQKTEFYLAASDITEKVVWIKEGRSHLLVSRKDAEALEEEQKKRNVKDEPDDSDEIPSSLEPVALSTVVHISSDDFWLIPDVMWKGPTIYSESFADIKMTCVGESCVDYHVFDEDFQSTVNNIRTIMAQTETPGLPKKGIVADRPGKKINTTILKFRHKPFRPVANSDNESPPATGTYDIEQWPARSTEAKEALRNMKKTHAAYDIDAFDMHGKHIKPQDYQKQLLGAVVSIRFFMKHYIIGDKSHRDNVYTADIASIPVIFPPKKIGPVTPKRTRCESDPYSPDIESPITSKKRKSTLNPT